MINIKKALPKNIYNDLRKTKALLMRGISRTMRVFPIRNNKVVFINFNGRGYGDNPKYLAQEFHKSGGYELFWITEEKEGMPEYIRTVRPQSLKCHYHMSTAKVWIDNARMDPYYVKRKGQFYLQTWHGSIALKKIEKDVESQLGKFYVESAKRDSSMVDLMLSNSSFSNDLYTRAFWYDGIIKKFGSPRIDCLFNQSPSFIKQIKARVGVPDDSFVILYAPTFRNSLSVDAYDIDFNKVTEAFKKQGIEHITVLVRFHPNLALANIGYSYTDVIDVTYYPDVYELLALSDVLITDYSSLMFEFPSAVTKPVFCYAKDLDEYDRGFYFDIDELPFSFARSNDELVHNIETFDQYIFDKDLKEFFSRIEYFEDGQASKRTVGYIRDRIKTTGEKNGKQH